MVLHDNITRNYFDLCFSDVKIVCVCILLTSTIGVPMVASFLWKGIWKVIFFTTGLISSKNVPTSKEEEPQAFQGSLDSCPMMSSNICLKLEMISWKSCSWQPWQNTLLYLSDFDKHNLCSPFQLSIFFRCSGDRFSIFRGLFWILIDTPWEIFSVTQPETNWGGLSLEPGEFLRIRTGTGTRPGPRPIQTQPVDNCCNYNIEKNRAIPELQFQNSSDTFVSSFAWHQNDHDKIYAFKHSIQRKEINATSLRKNI